MLFTGASGVGKSAVVMDTLTRLAPTHNLVPVVLNCSAQTSSIATQVCVLCAWGCVVMAVCRAAFHGRGSCTLLRFGSLVLSAPFRKA